MPSRTSATPKSEESARPKHETRPNMRTQHPSSWERIVTSRRKLYQEAKSHFSAHSSITWWIGVLISRGQKGFLETIRSEGVTKWVRKGRNVIEFCQTKTNNKNSYLPLINFALHFTFAWQKGTHWYLFVNDDWTFCANAPTNGSMKCNKRICYSNMKLTVARPMHGRDAEGVETHDTWQQASSDSKICWLAWFWRSKPDFATSTPVWPKVVKRKQM